MKKSEGQEEVVEGGFIRRAFSDPVLEKLYLSYNVRQKREAIYCFLVTAIIYNVFYLSVGFKYEPSFVIIMGVFLVINIVLLLLCEWGTKYPSREGLGGFWQAMPLVCWLIMLTQVLLLFFGKDVTTARDNLGWAVTFDYLLFVVLPLRLRFVVLLSLLFSTVYLVTISEMAWKENHIVEQVIIVLSEINC